LQLSEEETQLVTLKFALISQERSAHKAQVSRIDFSQRMKSSQSWITKIEAGESSVSLDLIVRALIASGDTYRDFQAEFTAS